MPIRKPTPTTSVLCESIYSECEKRQESPRWHSPFCHAKHTPAGEGEKERGRDREREKEKEEERKNYLF